MNMLKEKYNKEIEIECQKIHKIFQKACEIYEKSTPFLNEEWKVIYEPWGKLTFLHPFNEENNPYESFRDFRYLIDIIKQITGKEIRIETMGMNNFIGLQAEHYLFFEKDTSLHIEIIQRDVRACQVEYKEVTQKIPVLKGKCIGE